MRILFIGDVVGRSGREALLEHLPRLKQKLTTDVVIVNGENAAHGFGINDKICLEMFAAGVDVITTGNHVWDQREVIPYIQKEPRLLRPVNFPEGTGGQGFYKHVLPDGRKILVVNAMARLFMDPLDDPFAALGKLVQTNPLGPNLQAIFVDFHGEASSEKAALAHFLDGRVSAVIGTHTHVPTADGRILPKGTAFQTDAGMTGDYNSVIGMKPDVPIQRFTRKFSIEKLTPADGPAMVCGVLVVTDDRTGLASAIEPVRVGVGLTNTAITC
jgi:metallophosphoesterase (TIGR00282 family)